MYTPTSIVPDRHCILHFFNKNVSSSMALIYYNEVFLSFVSLGDIIFLFSSFHFEVSISLLLLGHIVWRGLVWRVLFFMISKLIYFNVHLGHVLGNYFSLYLLYLFLYVVCVHYFKWHLLQWYSSMFLTVTFTILRGFSYIWGKYIILIWSRHIS
jgi:hypothetical protein